MNASHSVPPPPAAIVPAPKPAPAQLATTPLSELSKLPALAGRELQLRQFIQQAADKRENIDLALFQELRYNLQQQNRGQEYSAWLLSLPHDYYLKKIALADNATYLYNKGERPQSEISFLNTLQIYPDDIYVLGLYADKLFYEGRQIEALQQYRRITELAPTLESFAALAKAQQAGTQ